MATSARNEEVQGTMTADTIMMTRRDGKHGLGNKSLVNKENPHPGEPGEEQVDEG